MSIHACGGGFAAIIGRAEQTVRRLIGADAKNATVADSLGLASESTFRGLRDKGRSPDFETVCAIGQSAPLDVVIEIVQTIVGDRLTVGIPPASQRPVDGRPEGVRDHAMQLSIAAQAALSRVHQALQQSGRALDGDDAAGIAAATREIERLAEDLRRAAGQCARGARSTVIRTPAA